jgi:hypothetical protein
LLTSLQASLAGYGFYYRKEDAELVCQTDNYGRNKYHMCGRVGSGPKICQSGPPPMQPECQQFFNTTRIKYPEEFEEIQVNVMINL